MIWSTDTEVEIDLGQIVVNLQSCFLSLETGSGKLSGRSAANPDPLKSSDTPGLPQMIIVNRKHSTNNQTSREYLDVLFPSEKDSKPSNLQPFFPWLESDCLVGRWAICLTTVTSV